MYCNRLHACWSTQSRFATLLSSLIVRLWVGLQTLWWFRLKDLNIDEMVGAWYFGCCQAHWGLPVGFLLLRYSVLFTVESLYLLYLLFIPWFICFRRWCIDKLGVFHANQTSMCLYPHLNQGWGWCTDKPVKPSNKLFLLTVPRRCLFCGSFMLFLYCFVMLSRTSVCWCRVVTCWERADLLALVCLYYLSAETILILW